MNEQEFHMVQWTRAAIEAMHERRDVHFLRYLNDHS